MSESFVRRIGDLGPTHYRPLDADLMDLIRKAQPMTPEQRFEQKVSWVYGQIGGKLTKEEVRAKLLEQSASPSKEPSK